MAAPLTPPHTHCRVSLAVPQIVATIGPATWEPAMMGKLLDAGVNVARFNVKHSTQVGAGRDACRCGVDCGAGVPWDRSVAQLSIFGLDAYTGDQPGDAGHVQGCGQGEGPTEPGVCMAVFVRACVRLWTCPPALPALCECRPAPTCADLRYPTVITTPAHASLASQVSRILRLVAANRRQRSASRVWWPRRVPCAPL